MGKKNPPWEIRVAFPEESQLWQSRASYQTLIKLLVCAVFCVCVCVCGHGHSTGCEAYTLLRQMQRMRLTSQWRSASLGTVFLGGFLGVFYDRMMDMGSLTCAHIWVRAAHTREEGSGTNRSARESTRRDRKTAPLPAPPGDRTFDVWNHNWWNLHSITFTFYHQTN